MMSARTLKTALLPIAIVLTLVLAGCTGTKIGDTGIQSKQNLYQAFNGYNWYEPVVTTSLGEFLAAHPVLSDPASAPRPIYQLLPRAGPEPSIGVTKDGTIFVVTLNQVQMSTDHGKTWKVVYRYVSLNDPTTHNVYTTLDPMLYVDPVTDRIFVSHLEVDPTVAITGGIPWCQYLAWSDDGGKTWSDDPEKWPLPYGPTHGENACLVGVSDHQKLVVAKFRDGDPVQKAVRDANPNKWSDRVLYYCHQKYDILGGYPDLIDETTGATNLHDNEITGSWCEASDDSGRTWRDAKQLSGFRPGCPAGLVGSPAAHPDGTVIVPMGVFGGEGPCTNNPPAVAVTEDNGKTWTFREMPNRTVGQTEIDPDITVTPDGVAYMTFRDKNQHMMMVRSADKFKTWEGPFQVSPPDHVLTVFTTVTSGDNGRIAVTYLGTRDAQQKEAVPSNATGGTFWHAYVSYSLNANEANPIFYTVQTTPEEDPAQIGCVWLKGGGGGPKRCRNLLDFIDMVSDREGRTYSAITDGCTPRNGCSGDTESAIYQSHDREAAVLIQDSGMSLIAAKGNLPAFGLVAPKPLPR